MKMIRFVLVSFFLLGVAVSPVFASSLDDFDPTKQYTVHSVPVVVDDPVQVTFDNTPSYDVLSGTGNGGVATQQNHSSNQILNQVQDDGSVLAPDSTTEFFSRQVGIRMTETNKDDTVDLTPLTAKAYEQREQNSPVNRLKSSVQSFFTSLSSSLTRQFHPGLQPRENSRDRGPASFIQSIVSPLGNGFQNYVVIPAQAGIQKATHFIGKVVFGIAHVVGNAFSTLKTNLSGLGTFLHHFVSETGWMIKNALHQLRQALTEIPLTQRIVAAVITITSPFWLTPIGKQLLRSISKFIADSAWSLLDLVLHTSSFLAAKVQAVIYHQDADRSYQANKLWIKKYLHRDIGDARVDLVQVGTAAAIIVVVYAIVVIGPAIAAETVASVKTISQETSPELIVRSNIALQKTAQDCSTIPGQCDTAGSAGLTLGSNFLFGVAPVLEDEAIQGEKAIAKTLSKNATTEKTTITQIAGQAEEGGTVKQLLVVSDDAANAAKPIAQFNQQLNFTNQTFEKRLGKQFIEEQFGSVKSEAFKKVVEKYPNAVRLIDENHGHIIREHLTDESYQILRLGNVRVASNFNTIDDLLSSIETTITDKKNAELLNTWISDPKRTDILRLYKDLDTTIGKNYQKINGTISITDSKKVIIDFKKVNNQIIINTGYPTN